MAESNSETITLFGKGAVEKLRALVQERPREIRRTEALVPPSPPVSKRPAGAHRRARFEDSPAADADG